MKKRGGLFPAVLMAGGVLWMMPGDVCSQTPGATVSGASAGLEMTAGEAAESGKEEGLRHKALGDEFRLREDIVHAGEEYSKALSLYRGFSREDRLMMARHLSWSGRLDEAVRELKALLAEAPGDRDARIHLARCLAWKGDLDGSLAESSKVLAESPDDAEALLVRANALKWGGDPKTAEEIYRKVLERGDDFDARLGLSYALLSMGDVRGAAEEAGRLTPRYPYQEKEAKNLAAEIGKATRPTLSGGYSYYHDSDDNRVGRYTVSAGYRRGNGTFDLGYRHVEADDATRDEKADEVSLSVGTRVGDRFGVGAGIGGTRVGHDNTDGFLTGHVRADMRVFGGTIGARVSREVFVDTAQLIENRIRFTNVTGSLAFPLPRRFSFSASASYKDFSDSNAARDVQGSIKYAFPRRNPAIGLGYRVRFMDFDRESGGGYFDPSDFLSHAAFVTFNYENGRFYTYLEPYGGHQSFKRLGTRTNAWFSGGSGVLGFRISEGLSLEAGAEGGDYAGGTAAGFRCYMVGGRIVAAF